MRLPQVLFSLTVLVLTTTTIASSTLARRKNLGVNCRGSSQCSKLFLNIDSDNPISAFNNLINHGVQIPGGAYPHTPRGALSADANCNIHSGDRIACFANAPFAMGSLCMFAQGNVPAEGISGEVIGKRIQDLVDHGCQGCGSVPLSGDNDPTKMGILTVNYVSGKGCNGLCDGVCGISGEQGTAVGGPQQQGVKEWCARTIFGGLIGICQQAT